MRLFFCMPAKFSYNKKEKLKSRKQLQQLFTKGKSFTVFPIKVFFELNETQDNIIKTGVGVSSRNFKKAVDRNYIKRLLREVYRTEKTEFTEFLKQNNKQISLFLLYVDKALPEYNLLQQKIKKVFEKLQFELNGKAS